MHTYTIWHLDKDKNVSHTVIVSKNVLEAILFCLKTKEIEADDIYNISFHGWTPNPIKGESYELN